MEAVAEPLPGQEVGPGYMPPGPGSGNEPGFRPIDDTDIPGEAEFADLPSVEPVIPFTGEELANGTAMLLMLGLRLQSPEEVQAFQRAFQAASILPPAQVLDALKVGEALAQYGIGKNRLPMGQVENLPPWVRIALGGVVLAFAAYGGVRAAMEVRASRAGPAGPGRVGEMVDE
ncbi:hypothetical protein [Thermus caldifontis]|uniref:hypothetical protein n=1 Tax=Thermus caldifontis TaxID=1930763 RepID=UPI001F073834|nr:hypothetical protein [Thermus caldifontis]